MRELVRSVAVLLLFVGSLMLLAPTVSVVKGQYELLGLPLSGGTLTGPLIVPDSGGFRFTTDATGWNYISSGAVYLVNAAGNFTFKAGPEVKVGSSGSFAWSSSSVASGTTDLLLSRDAAANLQLGSDAATATAQTISAADSTGANVAGASLTASGGDGTSGNATGGQLILRGGANAGTGEVGAVAFSDTGTKPTCAAGIRGSVWYDAGGAGVADTFEVCAKQAAGDSYAWRVLATIP